MMRCPLGYIDRNCWIKWKARKEYKLYFDLQKSYLYSKLAYLYYCSGDKEKAEECFIKYKSTLAASTPAGKYDATPYLFVTGRYRKF